MERRDILLLRDMLWWEAPTSSALLWKSDALGKIRLLDSINIQVKELIIKRQQLDKCCVIFNASNQKTFWKWFAFMEELRLIPLWTLKMKLQPEPSEVNSTKIKKQLHFQGDKWIFKHLTSIRLHLLLQLAASYSFILTGWIRSLSSQPAQWPVMVLQLKL